MKKTNNKAILDSILDKKIKQTINLLKESQDKFIQKIDMKKGELHKHLGIPEDQKLTQSDINKHIANLKAKYKDGKQYSADDLKLMRELVLARNMMSEGSTDIMSENTNVLDDYNVFIYKNKLHVQIENADQNEEPYIGIINLGSDNINNKEHVFVDSITWEDGEPENAAEILKDITANMKSLVFAKHID